MHEEDPNHAPVPVRATVRMMAPHGAIIECEMDMVVKWATDDPRANPFWFSKPWRDPFASMKVYSRWIEVVAGRTTPGAPIITTFGQRGEVPVTSFQGSEVPRDYDFQI